MNAMTRFIAALALLLFAPNWLFAQEFADHWHQFRGPLATGVAPQGDPPTEWSETKNVRWKVEIPGEGSSTPIVWGNRIFLLTAIKTDKKSQDVPDPEDQPNRPFGIVFPNHYHQFVVLCLDRVTGQRLWHNVATEVVPHEGHHPDNDFASSTPITDGKHLWVNFGSRGVYCYDLDGNEKWSKEFGKLQTRLSFGEGSSPALHDGILVTMWDHDGASFMVAQDAATGDVLWKKDRDEKSAWATPLIVERGGRTQVVTSASNRVRSYDLKTGELLWECGGQVSNVTPAPVALDNLVFCMSGHRGSAAFAIPLDKSGDLTDSDDIAWKLDRGTPYIPSPLLYEDRLYFVQSNSGILTSVDAATGKPVIETQRLPGIRSIYASPVAAAGRIYFTSRDGATVVIRHGDELEVLATNQLDDPIDASGAIVGKEMFLRGKRFLYCISQ